MSTRGSTASRTIKVANAHTIRNNIFRIEEHSSQFYPCVCFFFKPMLSSLMIDGSNRDLDLFYPTAIVFVF